MISIKTPEEVEKIRHACRIVAEVMANIEKYIKPAVTTLEIDRAVESMILEQGGQAAFKGYRGYRYASCISVNHEVVHGIPTDKNALKSGDILGIDIGAIWNGYYGDMARTFEVGNSGKEARKLLKCGMEALKAGIAEVKAGANLGNVSNAIESQAKKHGYSVVKDLFGHGIGKNLHEDPLIPNFGNRGEGIELKAGMVLAIEPMLNIGGSEVMTLSDGWTVITSDKSLSVHFEDTVLVKENGVEILTCRKKM